MTYPANDPLPPDGSPVEYEGVLVSDGRPFWKDFLITLMVLLWTAGAIGGVWYLCHRIDQSVDDSVDEALRVESVVGSR